MGYHIGFISTRFSGADGVTLEAAKWSEVMEKNGNTCFWFAGELDKSPETSYLVPEAHFRDEHNLWVNDRVFNQTRRSPAVTERIHASRSFLKARLHAFIDKFNIDILVAENVLTIPMHVPLGLALSEAIAETGLPCIAHHHDFFWERTRYTVNAVGDYLQTAFPPQLPHLHHVVINSEAQKQLALRSGIAATVIPNALDFENPPTVDKERISAFRHSIGLKPDDIMFLQPTRIVQRKGIESAIKLVKELNHPKYKLVVSHEAGDEGVEYALKINRLARKSGIKIRFIDNMVEDPFAPRQDSNNRFSLWEVYQAADFITYPSLYEGFGNALLEAIYFKKPLLVNRYGIFKEDIEPKGFDVVKMDGNLTAEVVADVKNILNDKYRREKMVATNYRIAGKHYSFAFLRQQFASLISNLFPQHCLPHQACHQAAAGR